MIIGVCNLKISAGYSTFKGKGSLHLVFIGIVCILLEKLSQDSNELFRNNKYNISFIENNL